MRIKKSLNKDDLVMHGNLEKIAKRKDGNHLQIDLRFGRHDYYQERYAMNSDVQVELPNFRHDNGKLESMFFNFLFQLVKICVF